MEVKPIVIRSTCMVIIINNGFVIENSMSSGQATYHTGSFIRYMTDQLIVQLQSQERPTRTNKLHAELCRVSVVPLWVN